MIRLIVYMVVMMLILTNTHSTVAQSDIPKFELGAHVIRMNQPFKLTRFEVCTPGCQLIDIGSWETGFGGRFSYNITNYLALEAELNYFPKEDALARRLGVGYPGNEGELQALFGAKAGLRKKRFGVFGKSRPGLMRFENVRQCPGEDFTSCREFPKTEFALDIGGVGEFYPSRNTMVRVDIGDTVIRFSGRRMLSDPDPPLTPRPFIFGKETGHSLQLNFGFGVRF